MSGKGLVLAGKTTGYILSTVLIAILLGSALAAPTLPVFADKGQDKPKKGDPPKNHDNNQSHDNDDDKKGGHHDDDHKKPKRETTLKILKTQKDVYKENLQNTISIANKT